MSRMAILNVANVHRDIIRMCHLLSTNASNVNRVIEIINWRRDLVRPTRTPCANALPDTLPMELPALFINVNDASNALIGTTLCKSVAHSPTLSVPVSTNQPTI